MNDKEFMECAECHCKPGIPALCVSCLHNRGLISSLQYERDQAIKDNKNNKLLINYLLESLERETKR